MWDSDIQNIGISRFYDILISRVSDDKTSSSQVVAGPPKWQYRLHSVVKHLGSSPSAGHYIADVFRFHLAWVAGNRVSDTLIDRFDAGGWWRYDDSQVNQTRWIWMKGNLSIFWAPLLCQWGTGVTWEWKKGGIHIHLCPSAPVGYVDCWSGGQLNLFRTVISWSEHSLIQAAPYSWSEFSVIQAIFFDIRMYNNPAPFFDIHTSNLISSLNIFQAINVWERYFLRCSPA